MTALTTRHCPACADERTFEVPPCEDAHDDCPDLACTACGYALAGGPVEPGPAPAPVELPHAA